MEHRSSLIFDYWAALSTKAAYVSSAAAGAAGLTLPDITGYLSCAAMAVAVVVPVATYLTNLIFKLRRERAEKPRVEHKDYDDEE